MQPRHQVSRAAIDLIETFEGYRAKAARLPDGRWTIGYGHTLTAREGAEVSKRDAEALLVYDLIAVSHAVNEWTFTPLTQNQFDALCAFAFNVGLTPFRASSVLRLVNEGQLLQAACAMELWRTADFEGERIVIDALIRRRAAEKTLFLTPVDGWIPVPSPVLKPRIDQDAGATAPRQTPVVLATALDGDEAVARREPVQPFPGAEGATATERAAAAVTSRLQTIFPDEPTPLATVQPEAMEPIPAPEPPAEPAPETPHPAALAAVTDLDSLPPPVWPMALSATALAATPRLHLKEDAGSTAAPSPPVMELPLAANESEPTPFDPSGLEQAMAGTDAVQPAAEPHVEPPVAQPPREHAEAPQPQPGWAPLGGLGGLGLAFFIGGLVWSGRAREAAGAFNPWIIGTLACLVGVGFMGVAVYLILVKLGHIERPTGAHDEADHYE